MVMRQMGEIGQTRSIRQWMAGITANGFAPNSHGRRVWSFARTSWNVKVKVKVTKTKNALCTHNTPAVWTKWIGLVADNVAQAAGASILTLAREIFAGMRSACGWPGGLPLGSATHF